jgi:mRNA-degrading endonuclease RelE of RelBE toxin-antitoxin system
MDKIKKLLRRLSPSEREAVEKLIKAILAGATKGLNLKKLIGHRNIYRVRSGSIRIVFLKESSNIRILEISRRSDTTYNRF